MKNLTSLLMVGLFLSCAEDPDPAPAIEITSIGEVASFDPHEGGYRVEFRVKGGLTGLRGNAVVRIGALGDGAPAASNVQQVPVDPDGGFDAPVRLTASKPGRTELFAQFGSDIARRSVVVPTGALAFGYLESDGGTTEGCVNLAGTAGPLVVEDAAAVATDLTFIDGTCDAPGPGKFARFPVTTRGVLTVGDVDGGVEGVPSVARLEITEPAKGSREVVMISSSVLPAAGLPLLVRLQVRRDSKPLPYVGYSLSVAPSNVTVAATQIGTTDANGEVSMLITAPVATAAQVLFRTGRFEGVFPIVR